MRVFRHQYFFYLTLMFLPTQLGYHLWPQWAMVLGRRVDYLSPTLFFTDILIALTLISWFIEYCFVGRKTLIKPHVPFVVAIVLFALVNIWFAASKPVAISGWIKAGELLLFGWYIWKTQTNFSRLVPWLSIGILYSSILAIIQFIFQRSVGGVLWFLGERTFTLETPGIARIPLCVTGMNNCPLILRSYATFPHPNVLGGFLAVTIPLLFLPFTKQNNPYSRLFYLTTILLGIIALAVTFSRSAWVIGIVGFIFAFVWTKQLSTKLHAKKKKSFPTPLVISISFLMIICFLLVSQIHDTDESVVVRQQLNTSAIHLWRVSPIVGIGLGNFLVKLPEALPIRSVYFLQPVHNIYLLLLSETGVVGLGVFLAWFIWMVRHVDKWNISQCTLCISFCLLLLLGFIDHYSLTLQQGRLLFVLMAALASNPRLAW